MPASYATRLDPTCRHWGPRVELISEALGEPLIPWQRQAARLITAHRPDGTWRYPLVILTVPRQSGKTTLLRAVHLDRLMFPDPLGRITHTPTQLWMTAQTGKHARRRWDDLVTRVQASQTLTHGFQTRRSNGSESLAIGPAKLSPFAPTPNSVHGETSPFVSIDEAWAFSPDQASALLAAIVPIQQNVQAPQTIIVSTAGDHRSTWFYSMIQTGRDATNDPESTLAYLECSADPIAAAADPYSPETLNFHPGIEGGITSLPRLIELREQAGSLENWRRGFLNLWPDNMAGTSRGLASFDAATNDTIPRPPIGDLVIAFDVAYDRSASAIWAGWQTPTGVHVALVHTAPGAAWLPDYMATLIDRHGHPAAIIADGVGYTETAAAAMTDAGIHVQTTKPSEYAAACAAWIAGLDDARITHTTSPELRAAYEATPTTPIAGGFGFDAKRSPEPIDNLRAAVLAAHHASKITAWDQVF